MRVLLIAPAAPQADGKGYAIRAAVLLAALQRNHEVELFVPSAGSRRRVLAALSDVLTGRPAQVGFSMPRASWSNARAAAARADIVVAVTVRAVRGALVAPLIVDHVDALSLNWALRARGPESSVRRLVARLEARRLRAWESRVAGWAVGQFVVSEHEVGALPESPQLLVVPHAVTLQAPREAERDIDVVFTGDMRYPPNREAALWLDRDIVPALRALSPSARVVVAGRGADRIRVHNAEVMSDVPSIPTVLARARVAIVPLIGIGTGIPTKALEAAACGAALVVTPWVNERLPLAARVADDSRGLAAQAAALLADESARAALVQQAHMALGSYGIDRIADQLDAALESARVPARSGGPAGNCPVCGHALGPVVLRSVDRIFKLDGEFGVRECRSCKLGVTEPRLEGEALARYYPPDYAPWRAREGSPLSSLKRARTRVTARLPPYGPFLRRGCGDVLDVGCGRGDLAAAFATAGWHVRALDVSPQAVYATRAAGIEAVIGTIDTTPWPPASFDLLILSHSLEHMPDPAGALRHARALLRPGGTLIVAVPDWDSWQRKLFGGRWALVDTPRHLQHFTAGALHALARNAGFQGGRTRGSVSASGLAVTLQYVLFDRWRLRGAAREALLACAIALYPLTWLISRPLGGDSVYLVAETRSA